MITGWQQLAGWQGGRAGNVYLLAVDGLLVQRSPKLLQVGEGQHLGLVGSDSTEDERHGEDLLLLCGLAGTHWCHRCHAGQETEQGK